LGAKALSKTTTTVTIMTKVDMEIGDERMNDGWMAGNQL